MHEISAPRIKTQGRSPAAALRRRLHILLPLVEESMIQAGERRLPHIMMTAPVAMAGMIPLAFGWGAGSRMPHPLAIAVPGGTLASVVLSLVVTLAMHYYIAGRH
jgi:multidrug efflux pump subunit AcrB